MVTYAAVYTGATEGKELPATVTCGVELGKICRAQGVDGVMLDGGTPVIWAKADGSLKSASCGGCHRRLTSPGLCDDCSARAKADAEYARFVEEEPEEATPAPRYTYAVRIRELAYRGFEGREHETTVSATDERDARSLGVKSVYGDDAFFNRDIAGIAELGQVFRQEPNTGSGALASAVTYRVRVDAERVDAEV